MNSILNTFRNRRSIIKYTNTPIADDILKQILEVGITSPTGDNFKTIELILVNDTVSLQELANARKVGTKMLGGAGAAIIVLANSEKTDLWIEDAAISAAYMHLAADSLGLGSCWIQVRARDAADGTEFESYLRHKFLIPDQMKPLCILSLGSIDTHIPGHSLDDIDWNKVHCEKY